MKSRPVVLILFLWLCSIISITSFGQDTPNGVRGVKDETGTAKPTGNQYALVVGVSKYHNIQTLLYADDDAVSFKDFLLDTKMVPAANIYTLLDSTATRSKFFAEISKIKDKIKENDRVIIYFAGHGDVDNDIDAGFLLGYNCEATPYAASDAIDISMLEKYVDAITKKNVKVILISDACRSGKLTGGSHGAELTLSALSSRFKNTIKILSCGPGELSEETNFSGGGHGIFTYYLLEALYGLADEDNNNQITKKELDKFLKDKVSKSTKDRQNPIIEGNANEVIIEVSPELKLAMLAKTKSGADAKSVATRSFGQKSYAGVSLSDSLIFKKFYTQLRDGKLNSPDGDNAYETYLTAKKAIANKELVNSMKYDLAAGLEDDVQPLLNRFTRGEFQDYPFDLFGDANKKLLIIRSDLMTPEDYRYNDIVGLQIFFSKAGYYNDDDALNALLRADSILPNTAYINCEIARCYSERSVPDTANAFRYFRRSMQLAPTWPFPHLVAGLFYMELKIYPEAKAAFEKALAIKKDFKLALLNTGVLYSKLQQEDKVINYYRQALQIQKPEIDVLFSNIGLYWKNKANYDSALYYQRKAFQVNPSDIYNITGLVNYFVKVKQPDSIKFYAKQLESITPSNADELKTVGSTYFELADYEKALKYFNKAQAMKVNPDVYTNIALTYDKMKNKEMAAKNYALALKTIPGLESGSNAAGQKNVTHKANSTITPSSTISMSSGRASTLGSSATRAEDIRKIGDTYIDAMDYNEAVNYYTKALAVKSSPYIYNNLGLAYENLKKLNEAKKYYREALQMDPDYSISIRNMALLYSKAGNYDSSFYFLRRRFLNNPNDVANLAFILSNFAKVQKSDSVSFYVKRLEAINTDNAGDNRDIADAFLDIPEYNKAIPFFLKSISLKPTSAAYNNLALTYENLQRTDQAITNYLQALKINPDYSTSIRNIALLYQKNGQYDSALYFYRKKMNTSPDDITNLSFMLNNFAKLQLTDSVQAYVKRFENLKADNPADIREIADAFLDMGDYTKAIGFYFKALAIKPSPDIYNNLALTYENDDKIELAKKYYKMAVDLQPDYSTSLRNLAILYNRTARYDSSLYYYKKLYAVSPAGVSNLSGLARLYLKLKQKDSALFYIKKLEGLNTDNAADLRLIADIYLDLPDYQKAISIYKKALAIKPAEDIYNNLAIAYENLEKYDDAKQAYLAALKVKGDYALAISNIASVFYRTKNYDSAAIFYGRLVSISKPKASYYNSLADALYSKSSYDSAIVYYKKAIALDSSHSNYFVNLGEAHYYLEQYAESVPYLEKAIAMDTSYKSSFSKLAYGYLFIKKYNDAITWYKKAIAIKPEEGFYNNIAIAYEDVEKYNEAKQSYQAALKLKPDYTLAMRNLASVYYTTKSYDSSALYYKKAFQISVPTAANYNSLADALYSSSHYDSAIVYYKKAIAMDSSHSNYFVNLGSAYYYLEKYPESVPYLEKALTMDTSYTSSFSKLAYGYLFTKKYNDAITWYKRAILVNPDQGLYNNLALAYEDVEKFDEAKQYYQLAIKFKPDYVLAINNLAALYYTKNNYDSAILYYRKIIEIGKPAAATYNSLANSFYSSAHYDSAIVYYKKAIALDDKQSSYFVNLGTAYYNLQQYPESVPYLEKALAMDTSYTSSYPKLAYGYMNIKKYDEAINWYNKILKTDTTGQSIYYYNIACAKSIQNKNAEALGYLDRSIKTGYTDLAHFSEDTDLDNIRSTAEFKKIIETYFKKEDIDKIPKLYAK